MEEEEEEEEQEGTHQRFIYRDKGKRLRRPTPPGGEGWAATPFPLENPFHDISGEVKVK